MSLLFDNFSANAMREPIDLTGKDSTSSISQILRFIQFALFVGLIMAKALETLPFAMIAIIFASSGLALCLCISNDSRFFRETGLNLICWHRDKIVGRRSDVCKAVSTKIVRSGGSSSTLRRAFPAEGFMAWASDIMTTRNLAS